ncbi:uncharacterized protein Dana_GF27905 [Drosophila ananassae]|uniref:Uncharacterized protein n=1 Tax=Drosophila ananassae TaxID=7217 RepID=A0A0P8XZY4_DROAN|nr:uncharacterized protein Dana_GF27905 [Drosophila ananassae]
MENRKWNTFLELQPWRPQAPGPRARALIWPDNNGKSPEVHKSPCLLVFHQLACPRFETTTTTTSDEAEARASAEERQQKRQQEP